MDKELLSIQMLKLAYINLLGMPHGGVRARNQDVLCALRDALAKETGRSSQEVQDQAEELVVRRRMAA